VFDPEIVSIAPGNIINESAVLDDELTIGALTTHVPVGIIISTPVVGTDPEIDHSLFALWLYQLEAVWNDELVAPLQM
jgi:hypothetical protein